jgi:DNA-directed RNA polymerase specialized sigma24 family protein
VDAIRARRRHDPLPEDDEAHAIPSRSPPPADPDRMRYRALLQRGLKLAISMLAPRDRLRLACYYTQQLTLAQTGRVLGEHEATASRQLTRTRREIRQALERHLKTDAGLGGPIDGSGLEAFSPRGGRASGRRLSRSRDPRGMDRRGPCSGAPR